jgi:tRNA threonylcarbamoyl adenosine modification protein YeaZ
MKQYGLALHSSTPELGLAIGQGDFVGHNPNCRVATWNLGRETSNVLHHYLAEFMVPQDWSDLAWVATGIGPGGFTGTRLAVVTARTIGQQLQIPVYGISNLAAIAWMSDQEGAVVVVMPAQREQVYIGVYHIDHSVGTLETIAQEYVATLIDCQVFLDGFDGHQIIIEAGALLGGTAKGLWQLAALQWQQGFRPSWQEVEPFYGQAPLTIKR